MFNGKIIGSCGEININILKKQGIKQAIYFLQVEMAIFCIKERKEEI